MTPHEAPAVANLITALTGRPCTATIDDRPTQRPCFLAVFVPGIPRPQGSKRPFRNQHSGRIAMVESSKHVKSWRDDIRGALIDRLPAAAPLTGAVSVRLTFVMPRPKSHYRTGRNSHLLRDTAPPHPIGKPDLDKLIRAVLDAIGGAGVWADDSQVTRLLDPVKRYGSPPGVHIEIHPDDAD